MNWEAVIPTVVGGSLSLVGALSATWFSKWLERRQAAEQLAKAFAGEIAGLLHIAAVRKYEDGIAGALRVVKSGNPYVFSVSVRDEYRTVYKQNASKLGSLKGDLPKDIAILYTQVASILEDLKSLADWNEKNIAPSTAHLEMLYAQLGSLLSDTVVRGGLVIAEVERRYPSARINK